MCLYIITAIRFRTQILSACVRYVCLCTNNRVAIFTPFFDPLSSVYGHRRRNTIIIKYQSCVCCCELYPRCHISVRSPRLLLLHCTSPRKSIRRNDVCARRIIIINGSFRPQWNKISLSRHRVYVADATENYDVYFTFSIFHYSRFETRFSAFPMILLTIGTPFA